MKLVLDDVLSPTAPTSKHQFKLYFVTQLLGLRGSLRDREVGKLNRSWFFSTINLRTSRSFQRSAYYVHCFTIHFQNWKKSDSSYGNDLESKHRISTLKLTKVETLYLAFYLKYLYAIPYLYRVTYCHILTLLHLCVTRVSKACQECDNGIWVILLRGKNELSWLTDSNQ